MNFKNPIKLVVVFLCISSMLQAQEEFKPHGKVFGEVFGDYFYKLASSNVDTLLEGNGEFKKYAVDDNAFTLRRFYLGYEYFFNETFSAKLMFEGNDGNLIHNKSKDQH